LLSNTLKISSIPEAGRVIVDGNSQVFQPEQLVYPRKSVLAA